MKTADTWQQHGWISGAAVNTVRAGGYNTALVRPGFRVIALNNNDCYIYNFWLLYTVGEARAKLQWLHDTLWAAEKNHERVHILKLIRSGSRSCNTFWQREYRRVIDRFHNIIGAQFNGHLYQVEYEILYDSPGSQHAVNIAWNDGAPTAYNGANPNYVLHYVDRTHYVNLSFNF